MTSPVAVIRLRDRPGVFVAEECELAGGLVHATGRTRERTGANFSETRWRDRKSVSWPTRRVEQITWLRPR